MPPHPSPTSAAPPHAARGRAVAVAVAQRCLVVLCLIGFSALAIVAGRWQWSRHEARSAEVAAWTAAAGAGSVPLESLVSVPGSVLPPNVEWRPVIVSGAFDPGSVTVLRNRAVDGVPGAQYLAWFRTDAGTSLLVLTGWDPATAPAPDHGRVPTGQPQTITVLLRDQEPDDGKRGGGATRITPTHMPEPTGDVLPGYGVLQADDDPGGSIEQFGHPIVMDDPSLGPHLAYSIQWFMFSALVPLAGIVLVRRRRDDNPEDKARGVRVRSHAGDEAVEDAL